MANAGGIADARTTNEESLMQNNRKTLAIARCLALGIASALGLVACDDGVGGDEFSPAPTVDCEATKAKGFAALKPVFDKCTSCHSVNKVGADRKAAPPGTDYDTLDGAKKQFIEIAKRTYDTSLPMPPAGEPTLTDAEKADLNAWAQCGTPP